MENTIQNPNALVHLINKCNSIVNILETRCIKFLWGLLNSENVLFSRICKFSMCNTDSTIGENIRYFVYKYDLLYDDGFRDLNRIYEKLDVHVHSNTNYDDVCLADAIRELCSLRTQPIAASSRSTIWSGGNGLRWVPPS